MLPESMLDARFLCPLTSEYYTEVSALRSSETTNCDKIEQAETLRYTVLFFKEAETPPSAREDMRSSAPSENASEKVAAEDVVVVSEALGSTMVVTALVTANGKTATDSANLHPSTLAKA